jgi:hypothetical protein
LDLTSAIHLIDFQLLEYEFYGQMAAFSLLQAIGGGVSWDQVQSLSPFGALTVMM